MKLAFTTRETELLTLPRPFPETSSSKSTTKLPTAPKIITLLHLLMQKKIVSLIANFFARSELSELNTAEDTEINRLWTWSQNPSILST
ncbi:hypothetical protein SLE2022_137830 [Rubroshorea leprosula]